MSGILSYLMTSSSLLTILKLVVMKCFGLLDTHANPLQEARSRVGLVEEITCVTSGNKIVAELFGHFGCLTGIAPLT